MLYFFFQSLFLSDVHATTFSVANPVELFQAVENALDGDRIECVETVFDLELQLASVHSV